MDLSSVRIAFGACAVFGGVALVGGGAVAYAAPGAHSAASDSASATDTGASVNGPSRAGVGKSAANGGASAVIKGAKSKPTLDLSSIFGSQKSAIPNPGAAIPNPGAAIPNPGAATPSNPSTTNPAPSNPGTTPSGPSLPSTGFGSVSAHTNTSGAFGPVERVVDSTWSVVGAFGNALGSLINGVNDNVTIPVTRIPSDHAPANGGAAVNGFLSGPPGVGNPGASALSAGRVSVPSNFGYYSQLPATTGTGLMGPISTAMLTPDLVSAAEAANAGTPPVITPIPVPGAKWLTDLPAQVREALRTATTAELLMGALPGLLGLVAFFVAGVGLGRRQAKFGFAMETTGIMRFAAKGPLGVVRGSFIAIHPQKTPTIEGKGKSRAHLTLVDRVA